MLNKFLIGSFVLFVAAAVWSWQIYPRIKKMPRSVSALHYFTMGVFLSGVLLFLPSYVFPCVPLKEGIVPFGTHIVRSLLMAAGDSMRLFVVGFTWDDLKEILSLQGADFHSLTGAFCVLLCFLAPFVTLTNVLNHFVNIFGTLHVRGSRGRKIYMMSELNVQSVALAEEIAETNRKRLIRPLFVFADAFVGDQEEEYELWQRAKSINGICLKNDISHIRFASAGKPVEIFLVGENETENIAQAKALIQRHKGKSRDISIYVYASMPYSDYILDSLDKGERLLHPRFIQWVKENPTDVLYHSRWMENSIPMGGNFSVQRLDPVDMLVKKVLTWNDYADYQAIFAEAPEDRVITLTVLGMGRYGMHFFKTAAWFYQRYGYCVRLNLVDLGADGYDPEKRLLQDCPELVRSVGLHQDGEAQCEVHFFRGIDCLTSDLADLVPTDENLRQSQLVFIALGDDDRNIQAAMNVRQIFEQLYMQKTRKGMQDCRPFIYAAIHDDQKQSNLGGESAADSLVDYRNQSYEIRFVGTVDVQYSYRGIKATEEREEMAFKFHLDWLRKESQLRRCYEDAAKKGDDPYLKACRKFKEELDAELEAQGQSQVSWNDGDLFKDEHGEVRYDGPVNVGAVLAEAKKYMRYAYFRNSSMAKADHKEALCRVLPSRKDHFDICSCEDCRVMRITEHMRWNTYTRSIGYSYNGVDGKNRTRAKLHGDLLPWQEIACRERYKD